MHTLHKPSVSPPFRSRLDRQKLHITNTSIYAAEETTLAVNRQ